MARDPRLDDPIWQQAAETLIGSVASGHHSFDSTRLSWLEDVLKAGFGPDVDLQNALQSVDDINDLAANMPKSHWDIEQKNTEGFDFKPPKHSPYSPDYNDYDPGTKGPKWDAVSSEGTKVREVIEGRETYAKDYWTGQVDDFTLEGKEGLDMSPHDSALNTYYARERMDQFTDDDDFGTWKLNELNENLEDRFLDEVYDNEGNVREGVEAHWGLDLRRVGLGHDKRFSDKADPHAGGDMDITSDKFYETLTRGEINWASYRTDDRYIAAFKEMEESGAEGDWDIANLGTDKEKTVDYINLIRTVNQETNVIQNLIDRDDGGWRVNWDGKYDPDYITAKGDDLYIDGVRQIPVSELYAEGKGRLLDPKDYTLDVDDIKTQQAQVIRPNITASQVTVTKPSNIPDSWDVGAGTKSLKIGASK